MHWGVAFSLSQSLLSSGSQSPDPPPPESSTKDWNESKFSSEPDAEAAILELKLSRINKLPSSSKTAQVIVVQSSIRYRLNHHCEQQLWAIKKVSRSLSTVFRRELAYKRFSPAVQCILQNVPLTIVQKIYMIIHNILFWENLYLKFPLFNLKYKSCTYRIKLKVCLSWKIMIPYIP